jgi:CubicO group peptidase (beta-lactamase class C family)
MRKQTKRQSKVGLSSAHFSGSEFAERSRNPVVRLRAVLIGFLALQLALPAAAANGQQSTAENETPVIDDAVVTEIVTGAVEQFEVTGMVAAVVVDGEIVGRGASGVRHIRHPDIPITVDDRIHLGSCSKAFTAALAGILVEEGIIDWDDTLEKRLPQICDAIDPSFHRVKLQELLTHRGAIPDPMPVWRNGGGGTIENRLEIVRDGLKKPAGDSRRGEFRYSNAGYLVAAAMMESATGEPWEEMIRKRIFEPLEMTSAGFGSPAKGDDFSQPWGHLKQGDRIVPTWMDNPASMGPAGTIHCNLEDWARFIVSQMPGRDDGPRLLDDATLEHLHTAPGPIEEGSLSGYACGWMVRRGDDGVVELAHEGSNTAWLATVVMFPETGTAILVGTNFALEPSVPANAHVVELLRARLP